MLTFQLALKNLLGAGIRTWLNVAVLAFAFIVILFYNGMLDGWDAQARNDSIAWEFGAGQLWHPEYDPMDPFTLTDAHGSLPEGMDPGNLTPVLVTQASIYPKGRMLGVMLKGIPHDQQKVELPAQHLKPMGSGVPAIVGKRMAKAAKLKEGESVTVRWRDKNGTFDALDLTIAKIFDANVPGVDGGQIWIDHNKLTEMMSAENQATYFIAGEGFDPPEELSGWKFRDLNYLLADINAIIQSKKASGVIIYGLLLTIALLAIFDTQVLSVFRRQKEIGTYIALGMTRQQVVGLFTIEGGANSLLAVVFGGLIGLPILWSLTKNGIPIPASSANSGLAMADKLFPVYGVGLVLGTTALMVISATIVSFIPARKISQMDPTQALKGKIQ